MAKILSRFAKTFFAITAAILIVGTVAFFHQPTRTYLDPWTGDFFGEGGVEDMLHLNQGSGAGAKVDLEGHVIMPKLGNATAKAALGRATWKLLHTITLRYPENPTEDEREALNSYFHLSSRLYPCGECAAEFQLLLKRMPPQTSSRRAAALWLCALHNEVNNRLEKPEFDCAHLDEEYDCGCGDEPVGTKPAISDDLEVDVDLGKDGLTGVGLIQGGR